MSNFEFEIKLPYPEKIIKEVKSVVKRIDDDKKEEQRIEERRDKNYKAFIKSNPFFKKIEKLLAYLFIFGIINFGIGVITNYFIPEKINKSLMPYTEKILEVGMTSFGLSLVLLILLEALAVHFGNTKISSLKRKK